MKIESGDKYGEIKKEISGDYPWSLRAHPDRSA